MWKHETLFFVFAFLWFSYMNLSPKKAMHLCGNVSPALLVKTYVMCVELGICFITLFITIIVLCIRTSSTKHAVYRKWKRPQVYPGPRHSSAVFPNALTSTDNRTVIPNITSVRMLIDHRAFSYQKATYNFLRWNSNSNIQHSKKSEQNFTEIYEVTGPATILNPH